MDKFNFVQGLIIFFIFLVFLGIVGEFVAMGYAVTHTDQLLSGAAYQSCKVKAGFMGDADALKKCEEVKPK